jgi:hypothetical protein
VENDEDISGIDSDDEREERLRQSKKRSASEKMGSSRSNVVSYDSDDGRDDNASVRCRCTYASAITNRVSTKTAAGKTANCR